VATDETTPPPIDRRRFLFLGGVGVLAAAAMATGCASGSTNGSVKVREPERIEPPSLSPDYRPPPSSAVFDSVIIGGRVMDPDSGYDAVANVGILGDRIALITTDPIVGKNTIDATDLVVAPGFIDVLSYEPNPYGVWYKIGDGVTTNLGMHGIKDPVDAREFFADYQGRNTPPVNFGGAFSDQWYRDSIGVRSTPSASQLSRLRDALDAQLDAGWIGVAIDPEYAPSIGFDEYVGLGRVAESAQMPLFTHIRYSSPGPVGRSSLDAIDEVLRVARETGVALHVDHIPSMATHVIPEALDRIETARREGLDITGCFYPYTFWGTYLGSARFDGDWRSRFRIDYGDLQVAGTSERLTESSFARYKAQNKLVVAYAIPQEDVNAVASAPWSMVGSDSIPEPANNNHPRGAGCFARLLGPYVRDLGVLSLTDALAKCTIIPARRLDARVPMLARKGRMQMDADADITVFDPATIADASSVERPAEFSRGVQYVFVNGALTKDPAGVKRNVRAGRPVTGQPA